MANDNKNRILAIDIGSENLKMAEFDFPVGGGSVVMTKFAFRKMERGDEETDRDVFARYYNDMLAEYGFTATNVRLSLSAQNSFQRLSKLPPVVGNRAAIDRMIEFEASQTVPYSIDEIEWDYQLQRHEWEEMVEQEDEDGNISEVPVRNEEFEALFIAMKSEIVVCYTDVIEESGKQLLSVDLAPIALFNAAVTAQIKEDECVLLLNIGENSTSLIISDHRRVFMRNIPIGGETITTQIAREFSVPAKEAEEFKRRYGFVALGGAYEEPESELASTISKLARNVMTRLHGEVSRSISVWRAQHGGSAPQRMLLSGGGSIMLHTTEFFNEKLHIPVEYLNTFSLIGLGPELNREKLQAVGSMSQVLIGLALRNLGRCPIDVSLLPKAIRNQMLLNIRKPFFYAAAATLVSCLLIFILGLERLISFEKKRVEKAESVVKRAQQEVSRIQSLAGELSTLRSQYESSSSFVKERKLWADMINELQTLMPDNMWLVTLEYDGSKKLRQTDAAATEDFGFSEDMPAVKNVENPDKRLKISEISNLQEIERVRLVGYTLDIDDRDPSVFIFKKAFQPDVQASETQPKSKYFELHAEPIMRSDLEYKLTYFELTLRLKQPIKK